ncbi:MAG: betaine--homocysteine S-methyltransferase [Pseudomonadota bacterium]
MSTLLRNMLKDQGWLLADGATGTNLFAMGLEAGEAPELWNVDEPEKIINLYQGAVSAGSDLFLTNSFGGNRSRLALHDADKNVYDLNARAAELGRKVADGVERRVLVAGSVGPTGELMGQVGTLGHDDAKEMFSEQISGLKEGGADVIWIETISAREEYRAAAEAASESGLPWTATMSFDTAGRTMMGVTSLDMVKLTEGEELQPNAYGANCGVGASDLLRTILGMVEAGASKPLISKGNAGIPKFVHGHIHYDGTPELMADYARLAKRSGAKIIGGCCGTTPAHLRLMRDALEEAEDGLGIPTHEEITQKLGEFSSASDGTDNTEQPVRSRRRKRR